MAAEIEKVNVLAAWSSEALPSVGDKSDQRKMQLFKHSLYIFHALVLHLALVDIEKPMYIAALLGCTFLEDDCRPLPPRQ